MATADSASCGEAAASAAASRARGWQQRLTAHWWRLPPSTVARSLQPLAKLFGWIARHRAAAGRPWRAPRPVVVVGNLVVGGAGKTPTVIALVDALRDRGWRPGVVSRGYGRRTSGVREVDSVANARDVGDEPWLVHRRTGVPVVVGEQRSNAVQELLRAHPQVDVVVCDDGLQHAALARDVEVWLIDERGVGNGLLLPAGPLRQPLPGAPPPQALVLYNAPAPTTPLPGALATRAIGVIVPLDAWRDGGQAPGDRGHALQQLRQRPLLALAGIASPQRFFTMLAAIGLRFEVMPLPDHAALDRVPWPDGTADVVCTEKDAAKLAVLDVGATRVWVARLDFRLPSDFVDALVRRLPPWPPTTA